MNWKNSVITIVFVAMAVSAGAQKVVVDSRYTSIGADVIIDNRDMPAGAFTITPKAMVTDGTATTLGSNTLTNLGSVLNNETVYSYFAVSKIKNNGDATTNWVNAYTVCANYDSGDGAGKWRPPTQRELQLLWILKEKLVNAGIVEITSIHHWSATENGATYCWVVNFFNGDSGNTSSKGANYRVRCVRDMTP